MFCPPSTLPMGGGHPSVQCCSQPFAWPKPRLLPSQAITSPSRGQGPGFHWQWCQFAHMILSPSRGRSPGCYHPPTTPAIASPSRGRGPGCYHPRHPNYQPFAWRMPRLSTFFCCHSFAPCRVEISKRALWMMVSPVAGGELSRWR